MQNVSQSSNKTQNNIYALSAATITGTAGAIAGYKFAPREAKNLNELINSSTDVFCSTLDNMQTKNPTLYVQNYPLISARANIKGLEYRINNAFPGDKISIEDLKKQITKQEKAIQKNKAKSQEIFKELSGKKGQNISIADYYKLLEQKKVLPEDILNTFREDIINTIGEETFNLKQPINDEMLETFRTYNATAENISQKEISMYRKFLKLELNGFVHKDEMLSSAKEDIKPITESLTKNLSFDAIKKYIPQKGQMKWAGIIGSGAALLTAIGVKIFSDK